MSESKKIHSKGKEYIINANKFLIFEGEYLNGERNGKGKEYDIFGNLVFEGEYLNGERNGKGKEYNIFGILEFEGEYLNDKKWNGKEKQKYKNGKIKFEREYINGKRSGKGYNKDWILEYEIVNGNSKNLKEYEYDGRLISEGEY